MSEQASANVPASKKRSHDEAEGVPSPEVTIEKSEETQLPTPTSPLVCQPSPEPSRQMSRAISVESSVLSEAKSMTSSKLQATPPPATGPKCPKKQKLTYAEKEQHKVLKQFEKEAQQRKKAEEAERKQQERLNRTEEKRRIEEDKEAARRRHELEKAEKQKAKEDIKRKKEEEKKAKEDDKRKKEEERRKKERTQLRLGSFFQKPVTAEASEASSSISSRRSSVTSLNGNDHLEMEVPAKVSPQKKRETKYGFLPFFVPNNVKIAPANRFADDDHLANMTISRLDRELEQTYNIPIKGLTFPIKSRKRKRCPKSRCTVKEIVDSIQDTTTSPIGLRGKATSSQLFDVPYKILSFREDVRPPYKGTYTRAVSPKSTLKLSRCPFARQLPNTNYDYDSEAEWEPPNEDDEDLESGDDESDVGEEGEEEMDGFLDDEDDPGRRKQVVGEMTPISSGLCLAATNDEQGPLEEYRMQTLSDEQAFPIDPFSTAYWLKAQQINKQPAMQPPRLPLSNLNPNRSPSVTPPSVRCEGELTSDTLCQKSAIFETQATPAAKPLKLAPDDILPAFKQAVMGSDLTKAGLVEILKKQFPKLSKDTIKDTLGHVAVRQGAKEADKKWVLKD